MSHELLNNLWGNSFFKASTAERMSQRMRCDMWQGVIHVVLVVFLYHADK